jgi:hypothetical protein
MKSLLLLLLLALPADAALYGFRITNWSAPALGYLESETGHGVGFGALYLGGYQWPLTGFDSWWHGGAAAPAPSSHMCLIIHPFAPWIVGIILWHDCLGKLDFLSADMIWYELDCDVELICEGDPIHG